MLRVIVQVKRAGDERGVDLEVPAEVPAKDLARTVGQALGWDQHDGSAMQYEIRAEAPTRVLLDHDTLASARVWDGTTLVFYPRRPYIEQSRS